MELYSNYFKNVNKRVTDGIIQEFFDDVLRDFSPYRTITEKEADFISKRCDIENNEDNAEEIELIFYDICNTRCDECYDVLGWNRDDDYDNERFFELCDNWHAFVCNPQDYAKGIVVDMINLWREKEC